ncbi:MAG: DUF4332 domain-containing protein [Cyanobacteria bacterium J06623_7]
MQSQYWSLELMPGLPAREQKLFQAQGIQTTGDLLQRTVTLKAKIELSHKLRLSQKQIDKWIALADLGRIPSVGSQYSGLLLHAGVISVAQLAETSFPQLHLQVSRLQIATSRRKDLIPPVALVKQWVEQAKMLVP